MHSPGHSRGTDSRHQADLGGHGGTPRHGNLSSGGHLRTRRDTRGHATDTVRDREAPGSNPGPPTIVMSQDIPEGFWPGERVSLVVDQNGVRDVKPSGAAVSMVIPDGPFGY